MNRTPVNKANVIRDVKVMSLTAVARKHGICRQRVHQIVGPIENHRPSLTRKRPLKEFKCRYCGESYLAPAWRTSGYCSHSHSSLHYQSRGVKNFEHKVTVLTKPDDIQAFKSRKEAAKFLGISQSWLLTLGKLGRLVNGYKINL